MDDSWANSGNYVNSFQLFIQETHLIMNQKVMIEFEAFCFMAILNPRRLAVVQTTNSIKFDHGKFL